MRTRLLTIAGVMIAGCVSVIISATPAPAQTVDVSATHVQAKKHTVDVRAPRAQAKKYVAGGCNDTASTSANLAWDQRDFFHSGHAYVRTGGNPQADFDISAQIDYIFCHKVVGSDKIKVSRFRLCATKNDNTDPHWDPGGGLGVPVFLRGFKGTIEFNTAGGNLFYHAFTPLTWDGNGSTGDKRCGEWWPYTFSQDNHWMLMSNDPYVAADGDTDIANAPDTSWQIFDDATGARIHFFNPANDNPV